VCKYVDVIEWAVVRSFVLEAGVRVDHTSWSHTVFFLSEESLYVPFILVNGRLCMLLMTMAPGVLALSRLRESLKT